jgi:hypothetical protein
MLPFRLVLDTNIVVSAALKPAGLQRTVFLACEPTPWATGPVNLLNSLARRYVLPMTFSDVEIATRQRLLERASL